MKIVIRYWLPAVLWAAVILAASSDLFSAEHTGSVLETVITAVFGAGALTPKQFDTMHFAIRKLAHLTEYAIFSGLTFRAVRGERQGWAARWAAAAVVLAFALAATDEWRQSFVPSRTSSPIDAGIDTVGAILAQIAIRLRL